MSSTEIYSECGSLCADSNSVMISIANEGVYHFSRSCFDLLMAEEIKPTIFDSNENPIGFAEICKSGSAINFEIGGNYYVSFLAGYPDNLQQSTFNAVVLSPT